jgi:hypothetical protein
MPSDAILHEAQQLHNVSDRLDSLADEHPVISEALITISGNVRHTATLLEVLVVTKMEPPSGPGPANAWLVIFCWNDVMSHWEQILRAVPINSMKKKKKNSKNRLEIARKIISDVNREMQKPRLTESVRNDGRHQAAPVAKELLSDRDVTENRAWRWADHILSIRRRLSGEAMRTAWYDAL